MAVPERSGGHDGERNGGRSGDRNGDQSRDQSRERSGERLLGTGEFARRSRLSLKALRLYERQGVLKPATVDPANGYRRYREDQLSEARLVHSLRRLDMPLTVVSRITDAPAADRAALLASYWDAVEQRVAVQRDLFAHLHAALTGGKGLVKVFEVKQRDVPEQVVLTEQRHVSQPGLTDWIAEGMGRVAKATESYGGIAGEALVIYYGEVSEDSDGPVEVALPIAADAPPAGAAGRVEPAHREAYVRLRKREVEFPQILSAYDAVAAWVKENGLTEAGAPREVYFADWGKAGPDDEVCDIAFPVK
ncbi:DNA-binding transcriptional MerR regulator [Saccharothrix tamanrassetensis]|uniref:DNA-binding transcriptional MerR regulator n=1 Tax=Saccharothrix tamanrassetensis TaxID=1051531 RepID=A0A841CPF1_9PSEU|nr:MerR family transcriptional regulator [Saccharothrix tamanrassetensis]MBB5960312.1 DNA-binding transcriptional MerR regulator [Saccharothrix tamanrassetensis]